MNHEHVRQSIAGRLKTYEKFELVPISETGRILSWYLTEPFTRMSSVLVIFHPEGITIVGDGEPRSNGASSNRGYGLAWFASKLNHDYLASKFLERSWQADAAERHVRAAIEEMRREADDEGKEGASDHADELEDGPGDDDCNPLESDP